jgi:superfamily II DNA/RNA helicase
LVPIINQIQLEKSTFADENVNKDSTGGKCAVKDNRVFAIIICPVRDLAVQLTKEARDLAEG